MSRTSPMRMGTDCAVGDGVAAGDAPNADPAVSHTAHRTARHFMGYFLLIRFHEDEHRPGQPSARCVGSVLVGGARPQRSCYLIMVTERTLVRPGGAGGAPRAAPLPVP